MKTIRIEKPTEEKILRTNVVEKNGILGDLVKVGRGKSREEVVWGDGDADVVTVYDRYEEVFNPLLSKKMLEDAGLLDTAQKASVDERMKYAEYAYRLGKNKDGSVVVDLTKEKEAEKKRDEEERAKAARENLHIYFAGTSLSSGCSYYRLSSRISPQEWSKVAHLFTYFDPRDMDDEEQDALYGELTGWLCVNYSEVERILSISSEQSYKTLSEKRKKEREEEKKIEEELQRKLGDIDDAFKDAEYPEGENSPDGEEIQHPENPWNIYGGGQWWVIEKEWIWKVNNNGMDGDAWDRNNVKTGGAGAIGVRIPFRQDIANLIRSIGKIEEDED